MNKIIKILDFLFEKHPIHNFFNSYNVFRSLEETQKSEKPAAKHTASTVSLISEKEIEVEFYEAFKPFMLPAPGDVHTISGADHDALMENPIYKQLFEAYNDAVNQVNSARGDLRMRCQGYEREIRGYRENIETMRVELERLREAAHAGT